MASRRLRLRLSLAFAGIFVAACGVGKREAASLAMAVERFHLAENADKPAQADFLDKVACTDAEVCDAKKLCVAAADPMARGLRLKSEVERGLQDLAAQKLTPGDLTAQGLPAKLDAASKLLAEGHAAMPACDAKVTELKRKYAL